MRTLLRSIRSGEYLQTSETWTASAGTALDFESIACALDLVRRRGLKDMALVLGDEPTHTTILPVAKLEYSWPFSEEPEPPQKPHLKKLAAESRKVATAPSAARKQQRKTSKSAAARRKTRSTAKSRAKR